MTTAAKDARGSATYLVTLSAQEREYLLDILLSERGETRVEFRHTDSPAFQERVHVQEDIIGSLLEKLHAARQSDEGTE